MTEPYQYRLSYDLKAEDPPLTKDGLEAANRCGCDAAVFLSLLYPPDGSFSMLLLSLDGRTGEEMSDDDVFKCWALLSKRLAESKTLPESRRKLALAFWQTWSEAAFAPRRPGE